jgi:large subunit ribosomal protein L5
MSTSYTPTLKQQYVEKVIPALIESRGYKNKHQVPKIVKISLNTGIDAEADKNQIADVARDLGAIAGQKPVLAKSKKAIANFKLRAGQVVGAHVTLRGESSDHP